MAMPKSFLSLDKSEKMVASSKKWTLDACFGELVKYYVLRISYAHEILNALHIPSAIDQGDFK